MAGQARPRERPGAQAARGAATSQGELTGVAWDGQHLWLGDGGEDQGRVLKVHPDRASSTTSSRSPPGVSRPRLGRQHAVGRRLRGPDRSRGSIRAPAAVLERVAVKGHPTGLTWDGERLWYADSEWKLASRILDASGSAWTLSGPLRRPARAPAPRTLPEVAVITGGGTGLGLRDRPDLRRASARGWSSPRAAASTSTRRSPSSRARGAEAVAVADRRDRRRTRCGRWRRRRASASAAIDILVNNAAGNFIRPAEALPEAAFRKVVDIVLNGTFYCSRSVGQAS